MWREGGQKNTKKKKKDSSGRRTHQPTKGNEKGHRRRQKGDKTLGKRKQEGAQCRRRGDKTLGKEQSGYNGKHPREGVPQFAFVLDGVSAFPRSCLPLSSSIVSHLPSCFPVLNGAPAFPRSCLPWSPHCSPFSPIVSPHVCTCVGWCVRLLEVLAPIVSHGLLKWCVRLPDVLFPNCLPLSPHLCLCWDGGVRPPKVLSPLVSLLVYPCLRLSPRVPRYVCLYWMVCPPS